MENKSFFCMDGSYLQLQVLKFYKEIRYTNPDVLQSDNLTTTRYFKFLFFLVEIIFKHLQVHLYLPIKK